MTSSVMFDLPIDGKIIDTPWICVTAAVEENKIAAERYISYLNILGTIDNKKW